MISINNNRLALNVANTLTSHYGRLCTSMERLASGLRVNSAADDAAGLAIREMLRADFAALNQGIRNANDAISMLQTFDGALSVIDEKLIRMKELAEQAATGTYTSAQRLMIDSEFKAMGDEINRIARSTDFNGIKLIDGKFEARPVHIVGPDGKTYDTNLVDNGTKVVWPGASAQNADRDTRANNPHIVGGWDISGIINPGAITGDLDIKITNNNIPKIGDNYLLVTPTTDVSNIPPGTKLKIRFDHIITDPVSGQVFGNWYVQLNNDPEVMAAVGNANGFNWDDPNGSGVRIRTTLVDENGNQTQITQNADTTWTSPNIVPSFSTDTGHKVTSVLDKDELTLTIDLGGGNSVSKKWNLTYGANVYEPSTVVASTSFSLKVVDTSANTARPTNPDDPMKPNYEIPDDVVRVHFGPGAEQKEDFYDIKKHDATLKGLGLEGVKIDTQDKAQNALVQVNDAIIKKDRIRAELGSTQNRLENTIINLTAQSENLQAAESQISDSDITREMAEFVRNQVLTNSAVAMLAQANSVPQMVMRLIEA